MGLALIFKALPFLWHFIREYVVGGKKLQGNIAGARRKTPWRLIVMVLFLVLVLFLNHLMDLNAKNEELEKKIAAIAKAPVKIAEAEPLLTRDHVELRLCQQSNQTVSADLKIAHAETTRLSQDVARLTAELASCKLGNQFIPNKPEKPKNDRAAERLEKLEEKEGGSE